MKTYKLPTLDTVAQTVVLANGEFPKNCLPLTILKNSKYIVCCDGAVNQLMDSQVERVPDAIVGDCDSLRPENRKWFESIIFTVSEQDTNDLTKSISFCEASGRKKIVILGATGRREDHTIGNISLLAEYLDLPGMDVEIITDYGIYRAIDSTSEFESRVGQQVSIFSIGQDAVTTHNLRYPITRGTLTNWWQGTLNEVLGDSFVIEVEGKTIVFRAF
ncbi:thiamine pyrophosphokinase [Dysgonomonas sp. PH5-45]|uniref:thiamine diphosphokinase n=1 Tax=unclassified Dysgonomonas TaxID=2630389 RepID=UPI0024761F93|nr:MULTISPECIES: thiamine diphosphokinase [unclassified Dysgonomonas]MDH6355217.1 thiamine pyrophosphokinase [Dysgonomonas sp. PH5-45]MDH6388160.1 thiamine pyrophosphokinase [Dysgonomonas sp. PH5-37]